MTNINNDVNLDDILTDLNTESQHLKDTINDGQEKENLVNALSGIRENIDKVLNLLNANQAAVPPSLTVNKESEDNLSGLGRIIEGVFNGEAMVGGDGKKYNIPANYASKSKLVEGDILKLTITKNGSFIYKQIGPIDREQLITDLAKDDLTGNWYALKENKRWRLLTASVTYFHGEAGDEVVILVPKNSNSNWAAVENIIKK